MEHCVYTVLILLAIEALGTLNSHERQDLNTKLDQILENQAKYTPESFCKAPEENLTTNLTQPTK